MALPQSGILVRSITSARLPLVARVEFLSSTKPHSGSTAAAHKENHGQPHEYPAPPPKPEEFVVMKKAD